MEKQELLYEGKAKRLFATTDANLVISEFKMVKDRFRQGMDGLKVAYEQVLNRILGK